MKFMKILILGRYSIPKIKTIFSRRLLPKVAETAPSYISFPSLTGRFSNRLLHCLNCVFEKSECFGKASSQSDSPLVTLGRGLHQQGLLPFFLFTPPPPTQSS